MSTTTFMLTPTQTTDTEFRAIVNAVHTAMVTTAGFSVASDTGQFDLTTGTKPSVTSAEKGFRMYQSNDGVSPTYYVRIGFGAGSALTTPRIFVNVGLATNGAGTLTGNASGSGSVDLTADTTARTCYMSYATGRLWMALCADHPTASSQMLVLLERFRTSAGGNNTTGVSVVVRNAAVSSSGPTMSGAVPVSGTVANGTSGINNGTGVVGADTYLSPIYTGKPHGALLSALGFFSGDIGTGVTFTATHYGATHTFLTFGFPNIDSQSSSSRVALLWE